MGGGGGGFGGEQRVGVKKYRTPVLTGGHRGRTFLKGRVSFLHNSKVGGGGGRPSLSLGRTPTTVPS